LGCGALMSEWLRAALGPVDLAALDGMGSSGRPGARVTTAPLAAHKALATVTQLVARHALPGARLVRVVWFSKDESSNWGVPWHQDRIIAVKQRHDLPGFFNWSLKSGVWHCEPPVSIFHEMRFVRVHLDDCDEANGAMQIAVGSEAEGALVDSNTTRIAERYPLETCIARRGDIQILPMLTLHRSSPARTSAPRRVIRLDFGAFDLPTPLTWSEVY
jgi:hypothetical protein